MLHITNGSCAVNTIRDAGMRGHMVAWDDVLHEGPVPAGVSFEELREVRAHFIADHQWASSYEKVLDRFTQRDSALADFRNHEEVVLWFEHDLYDQLQLVQVLDWFASHDPGATRLSVICIDEYLGQMASERVHQLFLRRQSVRPKQFRLASQAWAAFRAPAPTALTALAREDALALPYLSKALMRHLQQFPSARNGLSRSETQILRALDQGHTKFHDLFKVSHADMEECVFLGDTVFVPYLQELSRGEQPLLTCDGGEIPKPNASKRLTNLEFRITATGHAVLNGEVDRIQLQGIDRWLGGVHLQPGKPMWRWDETQRSIFLSGCD